MNKILPVLLFVCIIAGCQSNNNKTTSSTPAESNKQLAALFEKYYNGRMALIPIEATVNGDSRFNDVLPIDFTDSYRQKLTDFFTANLNAIKQIDREQLNEADRTSYDIFKREMEIFYTAFVQKNDLTLNVPEGEMPTLSEAELQKLRQAFKMMQGMEKHEFKKLLNDKNEEIENK